MNVHKDYRALLSPYIELGYKVRPTRNQHLAVLDPRGRRVTTLAGTPGDWRALANARATLRRSLRADNA